MRDALRWLAAPAVPVIAGSLASIQAANAPDSEFARQEEALVCMPAEYSAGATPCERSAVAMTMLDVEAAVTLETSCDANVALVNEKDVPRNLLLMLKAEIRSPPLCSVMHHQEYDLGVY